MITILIDAGAAALPDAAEQLAHLLEAGHRVVLVEPSVAASTNGGRATGAANGSASIAWSDRVTAVPTDIDRGTWLVTTDPAHCADRPAGLQTLLIGPTVADGPRPTLRCDLLARDLRSAVLEILARDVMP